MQSTKGHTDSVHNLLSILLRSSCCRRYAIAASVSPSWRRTPSDVPPTAQNTSHYGINRRNRAQKLRRPAVTFVAAVMLQRSQRMLPRQPNRWRSNHAPSTIAQPSVAWRTFGAPGARRRAPFATCPEVSRVAAHLSPAPLAAELCLLGQPPPVLPPCGAPSR
jgi:hypothetical protein